jgi:hypothetical protein
MPREMIFLNYFVKRVHCMDLLNDESLSIINKPKHPKKGKYKEENGRTHV